MVILCIVKMPNIASRDLRMFSSLRGMTSQRFTQQLFTWKNPIQICLHNTYFVKLLKCCRHDGNMFRCIKNLKTECDCLLDSSNDVKKEEKYVAFITGIRTST